MFFYHTTHTGRLANSKMATDTELVFVFLIFGWMSDHFELVTIEWASSNLVVDQLEMVTIGQTQEEVNFNSVSSWQGTLSEWSICGSEAIMPIQACQSVERKILNLIQHQIVTNPMLLVAICALRRHMRRCCLVVSCSGAMLSILAASYGVLLLEGISVLWGHWMSSNLLHTCILAFTTSIVALS